MKDSSLALCLTYHSPLLAAEANQWMKISMCGVGVCSLIVCWVVYYESTHEQHESPERSFKHVLSIFCALFEDSLIHVFGPVISCLWNYLSNCRLCF